MSDKRNLRVFCPTHEAAFEVVESPKILCEITEHALSVGFPDSEFWEFCCNCETFAPSKLDKGAAARKTCYGCGNEISKHFACSNCKIVAFECSEQTKGKSYAINADGIKPHCPGCQTAFQNGAVSLHQCKEIETGIFTSRSDCPFCLEKITVVKTQQAAADEMQMCPQCRAKNLPGAAFCGKCRHQLRADTTIENAGTDVNKTQMLGSLCPNCGTPVPSDSDFCGDCGQAVKKTSAPPPPPPPPPRRNGALDNIQAPGTVPITENSVQAVKKNNTPQILVGIGAAVLLLVIVSSMISSSRNNSTPANANSAYSVNTMSDKSSGRTGGSVSKTPNTASSDSRIGKTGTLTRDSNLRESASKDSYLMGTHYRGAQIKILDVKTVANSLGGTTDWFKIEVTSYGSSMDPNKYGQPGKDSGSEDVGWVNSYPEVYEGNRKIRVTLVDFD